MDGVVGNALLSEQLAYYRARAPEYEDTTFPVGSSSTPENVALNAEWKQAQAALHALGPVQHALELACGTGLWTRELVKCATRLTAIDGAPEMLRLNEQTTRDSRVEYRCEDLFGWEPAEQYDLVFFSFWLSHVPPDRLETFLDQVSSAVRPGGRVFIVDEPAGTANPLGHQAANGVLQPRTLRDGREFTIVKVFYDPEQIAAKLRKREFGEASMGVGRYFFHLCATRPELVQAHAVG